MKDGINWDVLVRYITGECSEEERAAVQTWAATDEGHRKQVDALRQVWTVTKQEGADVDAEAALRRLEERISQSLHAGRSREAVPGRVACPERPPRSDRSTRVWRRARSSRTQGFSVAAVLAMVALTGLLAVWILTEPTPEASTPEVKVFAIERGQRGVVHLIDGTQVHLNADSKLTLAAGFSDGRRRVVQLTGEAYFEVARDTARPFIVRTEEAIVEVLGTRFDVQAYPEDAQVRVVVAEGEVAVQQANTDLSGQDTALVLERRHLGLVTKTEVKVVREGVDLSAYLAWITGQLVFTGASFREVSQKLERWYDLEVEVTVPRETILELNATFDDESVDQVLGDIALALNLRYDQDGRTVTFYRREAALRSRASPQVIPAH